MADRLASQIERLAPGTSLVRLRPDGTYDGDPAGIDPVYFISPALGDNAAAVVCDLIDGDERFFAPADESDLSRGHNYNDNTPLVAAIAAGARGAYWDILRKLR